MPSLEVEMGGSISGQLWGIVVYGGTQTHADEWTPQYFWSSAKNVFCTTVNVGGLSVPFWKAFEKGFPWRSGSWRAGVLGSH